MLRIKYKNIFMQFMARATLFLWYGLIMFLWASPTYAQEPYYVDAFERPGVIYQIENGRRRSSFERNSGSIHSVAVWGGEVYFCSANETRIYQRIGQQETVIYQHTTYIRNIAFDTEGNLYFSDASGARSDGVIYKLERQVSGDFSDQASEVYTVHLYDVDGSWAGHFTFDSKHPDDPEQRYLYLSSGNTIPALIYRVPIDRMNRINGSPERIYRDIRAPIAGIAMDPNNPDFIYYTDWGQTIYELSLDYLGSRDAFSAPTGTQHLSDIAFDMGRET